MEQVENDQINGKYIYPKISTRFRTSQLISKDCHIGEKTQNSETIL